jgi:hypothetical protein
MSSNEIDYSLALGLSCVSLIELRAWDYSSPS